MIIIQPDNCQLCIHSQVCGIKQTVQSMKDTIRLNVPMDKSVNDFVEITVKCKHYQSTGYNWGTITTTSTPLTINYNDAISLNDPTLTANASTIDLSTQDALNNIKSIKEKE